MTRINRTPRIAALAAVVAAGTLAATATAALTGLDPTFGNQTIGGIPVPGFGGGVAINDPTAGAEQAEDVLGLADGTIAVGGTANGFGVARYTASGRLDTTFSGDGVATVGPPGGRVHALATGNTLPLLAAGTGPDPNLRPRDGDRNVAIVRGFGATGAVGDFGGSNRGLVISFGRKVDAAALALAADAPGGATPTTPAPPPLVAVGGFFEPEVNTGAKQGFVALATRDGVLVSGFGGGVVRLPHIQGPASIDQVKALAFTGPGRSVLAAGFTQNPGSNGRGFIVKLTPQGALDTTFGGGDGIVSGTFGCPALGATAVNAISVDALGRIVAAGSCGGLSTALVTRLLPDGTPDTAFGGGDGVVSVAPAGASAVAEDVVLLSDGTIATAGSVVINGKRSFAVLGLTPSGGVNTAVGAGGFIVTDPAGTGVSEAKGISLAADGAVIAAGRAQKDGENFMLARYGVS